MRITSGQLRQIIKEELSRAANETYRRGKTPHDVISDFMYVKDPGAWRDSRSDFEYAAAGGGEKWWRDENYPGWTDADFQEVIDALDGPRRARSQRD